MPTSDSREVPQAPKAQVPKAQVSEASSPATATTVQPLPSDDAPPSDDAQTNQPSSGNGVLRFIGSVFTLIFRLGLLTGGAGLALVVGVAIATIRPAEVANEPPLLETVIQQVDRFKP